MQLFGRAAKENPEPIGARNVVTNALSLVGEQCKRPGNLVCRVACCSGEIAVVTNCVGTAMTGKRVRERLRQRQRFWLDHLSRAHERGQSLVAYAQAHSLNLKFLYGYV